MGGGGHLGQALGICLAGLFVDHPYEGAVLLNHQPALPGEEQEGEDGQYEEKEQADEVVAHDLILGPGFGEREFLFLLMESQAIFARERAVSMKKSGSGNSYEQRRR